MRYKGVRSSVARKRNRKCHTSSIERLVAGWLTADGIPFKTEYKVGKCHIDIVIGKKKAVELNGCYWHCCHICFPNKTKEQQLKRFRDIHRYQFLGRKGFKLLVLWECFILGKPDEARQQLRDYANGTD